MKINDVVTESLRTENPCWDGYKPIGTKKKDGRTVPNCVPTEGVEEGEVKAFPKKHRGDLEDTHSCVKCGGDLQGGTYMGHKVKVCIPCKQVYLPPNSGIDQQGNKIKEQGVEEGSLNESPAIDLIRSLISEFNTQMSGSPYYPMDYKNPGMRMWTRGDGSKYKDPGYIFIDRDLKPEDQPKWHKARAVEKFWKFLESKGARRIGDVSGEFGSDPHSPAVVLNKLIFVFNGRSIAWGSTSRLKNSSVWRQKQPGVAEMDSEGYKGSRDRKKTSKYGSRDDYDLGGPESTGRPMTAKQIMDKAHKAMMKSMSDAEKVDKGWRNPNVDEGVESWAGNPSDRRHPGHESYMTPEYMLAHYKKRLAQIAAGKHKYPKEVAQLQAKIAKLEKPGVAEDWQSVNKKDKTDGMSPKAVKAYRRENPGSKLKTAVTKKPSELKPGSKDAKRRKSFCARMSGNKGPMKDEKGRPTPKAKALKRWNCE